jgi:uncharacterized protein (DUF3084 family)
MRWLGLALALALWLGAGAVRAADDAELAAWRQRLDAAEAEVTSAQQRSTAAEAAYSHMRHEPSIRGDEKGKIIAERSEAKQAVATAEAQLAEVREEARRAGAPLEWVLPKPSEAPADEP